MVKKKTYEEYLEHEVWKHSAKCKKLEETIAWIEAEHKKDVEAERKRVALARLNETLAQRLDRHTNKVKQQLSLK